MLTKARHDDQVSSHGDTNLPTLTNLRHDSPLVRGLHQYRLLIGMLDAAPWQRWSHALGLQLASTQLQDYSSQVAALPTIRDFEQQPHQEEEEHGVSHLLARFDAG